MSENESRYTPEQPQTSFLQGIRSASLEFVDNLRRSPNERVLPSMAFGALMGTAYPNELIGVPAGMALGALVGKLLGMRRYYLESRQVA